MSQRVALVTGATGFLGSRLVKYLLVSDWGVQVVTRSTSSLQLLEPVRGEISVHQHDGTIENMQDLMREARPHVVFHLASLFLARHRPSDINPLIQSNLVFGTQLVEAMAEQGVKCLVNTGTSWQHDQTGNYRPVNLYAATKQAFEDVLEFYVDARGLGVITLKLFDTYGRGDPRPKLLSLLRGAAETGEPLAMSPGEQQIDLVHVDDVVRAFGLAADQLLKGDVTAHERYSVSSGEPISLRTLVSEVERITGGTLPIRWGERPYRAREVMKTWRGPVQPGWMPRIPLEKGISELWKG